MFDVPFAVIGMIHLQPLPGSPGYRGDRQAIVDAALADADALVEGGAHAVLIENFGDAPFFPAAVPVSTVAFMTRVAAAVRARCALPLGVNVLRNDALAALAIAHAVGAQFIRVNVLIAARLTDQGIVSGCAHDLLRERARLDATDVRIFADVNVKHSAPLAPYDAQQEVRDLVERGGADAVIVSGLATGAAVDRAEVERVAAAARKAPVLVGSGVRASTVCGLLPAAAGAIVGTAFKDPDSHRISAARVQALMEAATADD